MYYASAIESIVAVALLKQTCLQILGSVAGTSLDIRTMCRGHSVGLGFLTVGVARLNVRKAL